jgi:hypothetical protein
MRVDLKFGRNWGDAKHGWEELRQSAPPVATPQKINGHASPLIPAATTIAIPAAAIVPEEPETLEQRLARIPLADLIGERPLNGKIACPFHEDDTPSLHVYHDHYHCFGCGAHGGHLDWLREVEGLDPDAVIDVIFNWQGRTSSPRQENDARTLELALALWQTTEPIAGTWAARYLAEVRGIGVEMLPADIPLRFHPRCTFGPGKRLPSSKATNRPASTASL